MTKKDANVVEIDKIPTCDVCGGAPAEYDGKTRMGAWAYMCKSCYAGYGVGIGKGKGQILRLKENK